MKTDESEPGRSRAGALRTKATQQSASISEVLTRICDALSGGLIGKLEPRVAAARVVRELSELDETVRDVALLVTLDRDIAVEAGNGGPIALSEAIGRQTADATYEALKQLRRIWFSLKSDVPVAELEDFLTHCQSKDLPEARPATWGAPHLSTLHSRDLPADAMDLPWPAQLALSRIAVELADAPALAAVMKCPQTAARQRLMGDILAHITDDIDLEAVVSLIALRAGDSRPEGRAMLADVLRALTFEVCLRLGRDLLSRWETEHVAAAEPEESEAANTDDDASRRESLSITLAAISGALAPRSMLNEVAAFQDRLYESGAVALEELPGAIQELLARRTQGDLYLRCPAKFLAGLDQVETAADYRDSLTAALRSFPDLLRSKRFDDGDHLAKLIGRHRDPKTGFAGRALVLEDVLASLASAEVAARFVRALSSDRPRVRAGMARLILVMGSAAPPLILRALYEGNQPRLLAEAEDLLSVVATAEWLADQLQPVVFAEKTATVLLQALGRSGNLEHARIIAGYIRHTSPLVRLAALRAAHTIGSAQALPVLVPALRDPAAQVVTGTITILGQSGYRDIGFVRFLAKLACDERATAQYETAAMSVRIAAAMALRRVGDTPTDDNPDLEQRLLQLLGGREGWRRLAVWRRNDESDVPRELKVAACRALGRIGSEASIARFRNQDRETDKTVRGAMIEAAAEINRRATT
ncbi:MAG: HEAT repeat protein [Myxococcota bacterium]|jgi:HEAT repeat protein